VTCVEALVKELLETCRRKDMPFDYRLNIRGTVTPLRIDHEEQIQLENGRLITRCNGESHECILSSLEMSAGNVIAALSTHPDVRDSVFIPKRKPAAENSTAVRSTARKPVRKKKRRVKPAKTDKAFRTGMKDFWKIAGSLEKKSKKP
jgi:hypothetical protein